MLLKKTTIKVEDFRKCLDKKIKEFNEILKEAIDIAISSGADLKIFDYGDYGIRKFGYSEIGYFYFFIYLPTYKVFPTGIDKCYARDYLGKYPYVDIEYMDYEETLRAIDILPEFIEEVITRAKQHKKILEKEKKLALIT